VSEEARRNLIALGIVAVILAVFAAFAIRPGVLLPVTDHAVADSVELADDAHSVRCIHTHGAFRCVGKVGSFSDVSTLHLVVHVGWDGCWQSVDVTSEHPERDSGCLHLWNYVG
jgi:hypothetical protein